MKFDVDDKNRCLVCKISFKSVQVCGGCCKMFMGLTFLGHSVVGLLYVMISHVGLHSG